MRKTHYKDKSIKWLSAIAILLVTILLATMYAGSFSNKSGKLGTNLGKDNITINAQSDNSVYPVTQDEVLYSAVKVAMDGIDFQSNTRLPYGGCHWDYFDCSTYASAVLENLGFRIENGDYEYMPANWGKDRTGNIQLSRDGNTYTLEPIMYANDKADGVAWYEAIDATKLQPGDIIAGGSHMFVYVGNGTDSDEIIGKLEKAYNKNKKNGDTDFSTVVANAQNKADASLNKNNLWVNTAGMSTYWELEGNTASAIVPVGTAPLYGAYNAGIQPPGDATSNFGGIRPIVQSEPWREVGGYKSLRDVYVYRIAAPEEEEVPDGTFNFNVVKYIKGTTTPLTGASFKVTIKDNENNPIMYNGQALDGTTSYRVSDTTGTLGQLNFNNLEIAGENLTYHVTIEEDQEPQGYERLGGAISFDVTTKLNTNTNKYELVPATPSVQYTKKVEVKANQILVEVENKPIEVIKNYGNVGLYKYIDKNRNEKYDDGEPALQGAKFKIATSEENAKAGIFIKGENGKDLEAITGKDGKALITNLELGDATEKDYYIVETYTPSGFKKIEEILKVKAKREGYNLADIKTLVQLGNKEKIYDLSLRKFITAVKDTTTGEETAVTDRVPKVKLDKLVSGESTTAEYTHPKDPVLVHTTDIVTYTIRVYNEGSEDAYASIVKDDIQQGLEFVPYKKGDGSINDTYKWIMVDENDNEVTDASKAKYIITDYLDKDSKEKNLIKGYDPETMDELDYRDLKVQFKVVEPTKSDRILENQAQISKETDKDGNVVTDRDSTPNEWKGEDDEDVEYVKVKYFDLALRKWVTEAIVTIDGKTTYSKTGHKAEDNPEDVVKVDLKKSKINDVVVKFKYSIRITNQGQIAGEATKIRDDIPQGLKFVAADNPDWREENGKIVTNKLADRTLQPGESAEVEIILTWINGANNMGTKINVAEINKDHNNYGTKDVDSTPGNNVPKEDDIDDAPVMLSVKTGLNSTYIILIASVLGILGFGVFVVKKLFK